MLLREAPRKNSGFIWELLNAFDKFHPKFGFGFGSSTISTFPMRSVMFDLNYISRQYLVDKDTG